MNKKLLSHFIVFVITAFIFIDSAAFAIAPIVNSVSPSSGSVRGGAQVTVKGFNFGTAYRKPIIISNGGVQISDYQLLVIFDTAQLIVAGKMRTDCGDVRVFDTDETTLLNYWIESGCNTALTRIWVKVPVVPSGFKQIYINYGYPAYTSLSNPQNVFILYEDAEVASSWTETTLWERKTCYANAGSYSWGYSNAGCADYDTGARNFGDIISPSFTLPFGTSLFYYDKSHTEYSGFVTNPSSDRETISISTDGGDNWSQISLYSGQWNWTSRSISLASYSGSNVKIRFSFDTVDRSNNNTPGWYADTIFIRKTPATTPSITLGPEQIVPPKIYAGGNPLSSVFFENQNNLTGTTPPHSAQYVDITVVNPNGESGTLTNGFRYIDDPLTVTVVNPNFGSTDGGTSVTIEGSNFFQTPTVKFGGVYSSDVVFVSPTMLSAITPSHGAGIVDVLVENPDGGSGLLVNGFRYEAPYASGTTNIDFSNRWAWNDVIGWMDFYSTGNVNVLAGKLQGYATSSVGYIALHCDSSPNGNICGSSNFGVTNDGAGNLSGWAWNDEIGWISFDCRVTVDNCLSSVYQVTIDANGNFGGWAWNDVVGWISFGCGNIPGSCTNSSYKVQTSWRPGGLSATLESSVFDTRTSSTLNSIFWYGFLPTGGRVAFQIASADSPTGPWVYRGPDGTGSTFYQSAGSGISMAINRSYHNNYRYFKYLILIASDPLVINSPRIDDVFINWSP